MEETRQLVRKVFEQGGGDEADPKRQRLQQDALSKDAARVLVGLNNFFQLYDTVSVQFTTIWRLIQIFPSLVHWVWNEKWFRHRVQREFSDAYYGAVQRDDGKSMDPTLAAELIAMSVKSELPPFSEISEFDSRLLWFLYYQRLRRIGILFRQRHRDKIRIEKMTGYKRLMEPNEHYQGTIHANGPFLVTTHRALEKGFRFEFENWVTNERLGWLEFGSFASALVVAITQTYFVHISMERKQPKHIGLWDLRRRNSEQILNDPNAVQRAKMFYHNQCGPIGSGSLQSYVNSNLVRFGKHVIDLDEYAKLLAGEIPTPGLSILYPGVAFDILADGYVRELKTNHVYALRNPVSTLMTPPRIRDGEILKNVLGPFFSVDTEQPLVLQYGYHNAVDTPKLFPGNAPAPPYFGFDQEKLYSSMLLFERGISSYWQSLIFHANGWFVDVKFSSEPYGTPYRVLAISGYLLLVRLPDEQMAVYDLEQLLSPTGQSLVRSSFDSSQT